MAICVVKVLPVRAAAPTPGVSASPGFVYGRAGDFSAGTYFQVLATVPSNTAGNIVPFDGIITRVFITNESINTYSVQIQTRSGAVFTDIGAPLALVAARKIEFPALTIAVSNGDEVVVKCLTGSGRNGQVGLIIEQS